MGRAQWNAAAVLLAARAEPDTRRRLALYHEAEAAILSDLAVIPLQHPAFELLVKPHVQNYVHAPMAVPFVHRVSLAWPGQ